MVNEVYVSIQGESSFAGRPCIFVRLTGCNLRCAWCDTAYAFHEGQRRSIDDIVRQVASLSLPLVEITGGEPLLQPGCAALAQRLLMADMTVLVETSGSLPINTLPDGVVRIMDIKCPGSGEVDKMDWRNLSWLTERDEVKFVVSDRDDYEWARDIIRSHGLIGRCEVLISTAYGLVAPRDLAEWILMDKLQVRLQLQLHKYIWEPDKRGV